MLFSFKKEGNFYTYYTMDEPWGCYSKWNKPVKKDKQVWLHSHDISGVVKLIETESHGGFRGLGTEGNGKLFKMSFSFIRWNSLEIGCTIMWVYVTLLNS